MAETPYFKFRLPPDVLADLNALAASNGGNNTLALKESLTQMRAAVEEAARLNADELSREDWIRLGHLNDPDPFGDLIDGEPSLGRDWSQSLAMELTGMWEGKDTTLPLHRAEAKECAKLAKRIASWGRLRGYSLMCALRYFWRHQEAGIAACASPEIWMTPTAK